jgi:hypothetical protein
MRQNLNHCFGAGFSIWSTKLGADVVGAGDSLVTEKSLHSVVRAIRDACYALDEGGSIHWPHYLRHVENTLPSHDFYLDDVSIVRQSSGVSHGPAQ